MKRKIGKDDKEFAFFRDFWKFYEDYYYPEKNEQYWENVVRDSNNLCLKYSDITIARKLIMQVIVELEERNMRI